jgi:hypothetical protein
MKNFLLVISVIVGLLFVSGCSKENAVTDTELSYSFSARNTSATLSTTATASGVATAVATNGSINWAGIRVNVSKIEFTAIHLGTSTSVELKNLYNINALKPDSLSGKILLTAGVYENIRFKLTLAESATNPPLILNGNYVEASGTIIPVVVQFNQSQFIDLEAAKIEVSKGKYIAKITLELNALVKGLVASDFGQTVRTNNTIVVNSTTNRALYEKLVSRLVNTTSVSVAKQ